MRKIGNGLTVLVIVLGVACSTSAAPIFVANAGFDDPVLVDSAVSFAIPGWTNGGDSGVFNPHAAAFLTGAPEGENVAFSSGGGPDWGGPVVSQVLSATLQANTFYTLSMLVGNRLDADFPGYETTLLAGGVVIAQDHNTLAPLDGEFLLSTIFYFAGAGDPLLGSLLEIQFRSLGPQANFDDVKLDATEREANVPEPVTLALLGMGGLGVFVRRRRLAQLQAAVMAIALALALPAYAQSQSPQFAGSTAEELVATLSQFPASLPGIAPSNGVLDPTEQRRRSIFDRLRGFGSAAIPALNLGLTDPNVQIRRNVALVLLAAGGSFEPTISGLDIRDSLSALIAALADTDARVTQLAAQAVGTIGPEASSAVPALIALLESADQGSRNSACLGLTGIGPNAREALPALRHALSDPSVDVRWFARRAIETIEKAR